MATTAVILGNGEPPSRQLFAGLMTARPLLLCADGGANLAADYGCVPDFVVGDLDSVRDDIKSALPADRLIRVDADNTGTDLQKVLRQAVQLNVTEATLLGFTGRRTDHTLWNLSLLKTFGAELALRILDDHCEIRLIGPGISFSAPIGQKLSLCPLAGAVDEVATAGLRFALHGESLAPGIRDGISNEVVADPVRITVGEGDLLLCLHREGGVAGPEMIQVHTR